MIFRSGYYALKQKDIPLESRIIAVCDSIDAMTSKRAYREPLTLEFCKQEIEINSGKMYDPRVASIAIKNFEKLVKI